MNHTADNCIFCKIIEEQIPCSKVYEDEHVLAFLDISQVTKGHTLVIPKVHKQDIFALTPEIASHIFSVVPKISNAIKSEFNSVGFNLLNNNGEKAGQTVFHFHLHLIPRYGENDGFGAVWKSHQNEYTTENLQNIASTIANSVK
ncbi:HIT family protein [Bacillus pseudomycoides]|uniref:HIT family protein n=1 Tax=Bacillus pseudomycoides TaxID=64104 RepID=UPI000BEE7C0F|nr:HIT family protein [Bacillus pseudomycoides]PEE36171.1 HIT family protein [Bacillus pseudomycoides]PGA91208.1 HIT family protein [Bacillus pseudomycoides]PHF39787.1 HIT family protein [Bacillus pseudomycoides]